MLSRDILEELDRFGYGSDIEALENDVRLMQESAGEGHPIANNTVYDAKFRLLSKVKPDSELLSRNWENEDFELDNYDEILDKYGMCSILTVTSMEDLKYFVTQLENLGQTVDLIGTTKEDGHGTRCIYVYGKLFRGNTRGRYKKGRDITRHFKLLMPNYVEEWASIPIVEVRNEMVVKKSVFEEHFKHKFKTPLSTVTSIIRDSATDEEIKFLSPVCYKVIASDGSLQFKELKDELDYLTKLGFEVPEYAVYRGVTPDNFYQATQEMLNYFEKLMDYEEIEYMCDGVVVAINNNEVFYSLGKDKNRWKANFAMKMGKYWESNKYESKIIDIEYSFGRYITPKAIIEPVQTVNGTTVKVVPLYNIGVMEKHGYTIGNTIYFRYGGETGVTCCDYSGKSV